MEPGQPAIKFPTIVVSPFPPHQPPQLHSSKVPTHASHTEHVFNIRYYLLTAFLAQEDRLGPLLASDSVQEPSASDSDTNMALGGPSCVDGGY